MALARFCNSRSSSLRSCCRCNLLRLKPLGYRFHWSRYFEFGIPAVRQTGRDGPLGWRLLSFWVCTRWKSNWEFNSGPLRLFQTRLKLRIERVCSCSFGCCPQGLEIGGLLTRGSGARSAEWSLTLVLHSDWRGELTSFMELLRCSECCWSYKTGSGSVDSELYAMKSESSVCFGLHFC